MALLDGFRRWIQSRRVGPAIDENAPLPGLDTTMIAAADAALATSRRRGQWLFAGGIVGVSVLVGAGAAFIAAGGVDELRDQNVAAWTELASFLGLLIVVPATAITLVAGWLLIRRHRLLATARASHEWSVHHYTWYVVGRGRNNVFWMALHDGDELGEWRLHLCVRGLNRLRRNAPGVALLLDATPKMVAIWIPGSSRIWTGS